MQAVVAVVLLRLAAHLELLAHLVFRQMVVLVVTVITLVLAVLEVLTLDKVAAAVQLAHISQQSLTAVMVVLEFVWLDMMQRHYRENR
jgi:hypothetical protein